jgi:hypothetical protein
MLACEVHAGGHASWIFVLGVIPVGWDPIWNSSKGGGNLIWRRKEPGRGGLI